MCKGFSPQKPSGYRAVVHNDGPLTVRDLSGFVNGGRVTSDRRPDRPERATRGRCLRFTRNNPINPPTNIKELLPDFIPSVSFRRTKWKNLNLNEGARIYVPDFYGEI